MTWKRTFFIITAGQTVSLVGSSAVQFAMIWWLSVESGSAVMLSLAGLAAYLPTFFLSPFAGVWIDRLRRKHVVVAADMFMGAAAGIFALVFFLAEPPYWSIGLVLCIRGIGTVFHTPAIQSLMPCIVPDSELMRANGWSQFMQSGAFMLGPVLGGLMYGALPMPVILLTDLFGAAAASLTLAAQKIAEPAPAGGGRRHFLAELREGAAVLGADRTLCGVMFASLACMICYMPLSSLYPLMTSNYFRLGPVYGSLVELGFALGMMGTSLGMGILGRARNKILFVHIGLWGLGAASFLAGLLPPSYAAYWVFVLLCTLLGASSNFYSIPLIAYMQENIPREKMGRAFSLWAMAMSAAMPLGLLVSGPVAEKYGVTVWLTATGVVSIAAATVNYLLERRRVPRA